MEYKLTASVFNSLCEASQFSFSDDEKENFIKSLESMIKFAKPVKNCELAYEEVNLPPVTLNDLREDVVEQTYTVEALLENTESLFDCYVIPKIME